ncbi:class I SAM-dependent methyltransferase [Rhodocyclaceae bacterium]
MPTFLHVGCGSKSKDQTTKTFKLPQWQEVRLDINGASKPDIVGTMLDMSAVQSESLDALYSSHNIEHLFPHEVPIALKEFQRVLKPDGFVVITCPDLQSVAKLIAEDKLTDTAYEAPCGPIAPIDILYGYRGDLLTGNHYMAHKCGFTLKVLIGTLQHHGFKTVVGKARGRSPYYDLWVAATKQEVGREVIAKLAAEHFPA